MMLRIGQAAATVPSLREGDRHARGPSPPDLCGTLPDPRPEEKRAFRPGDRPPARPRPHDGMARGAAQRRQARLPPQASPAQVGQAPQRGLVGGAQDDAGAVAHGGGAAGRGLEPRAGQRAPPQGGRADGGASVDLRAHPRRPEGRRRSLAASPPPREEAEPEGRGPRGPRPHPGPGGHLRAPGRRGGEGTGRRPGGGHESTARAPAARLSPWWTGRPGTRCSKGSGGRRRTRSARP